MGGENAVKLLKNACVDPDAHVRLAAHLALSECPASAEAGKNVAENVLNPGNLADRWLPDALTAAAATHAESFLRELGRASTADKPLPAKVQPILAIVAEHFARGGTAEAPAILAAWKDANAKDTETVLAAFAKGWPRGKTPTLTPEAEQSLAALLAKLTPAGRGQLVKLAGQWGSNALAKHAAEVVTSLLKSIRDGKSADADRVAAAKQAVEFRPDDADVVACLLDAVTPRHAAAGGVRLRRSRGDEPRERHRCGPGQAIPDLVARLARRGHPADGGVAGRHGGVARRPRRRHRGPRRTGPRPEAGAGVSPRQGDGRAGEEVARPRRRPAQPRPAEGHRRLALRHQEGRRRGQGQGDVQEALRDVPRPFGRGEQGRPRA